MKKHHAVPPTGHCPLNHGHWTAGKPRRWIFQIFPNELLRWRCIICSGSGLQRFHQCSFKVVKWQYMDASIMHMALLNNYEHIHCVLILMNVCVTKPEMFLSSLHQRQNWRNHRSSMKLTFTWRNIMQFLQPDIVHSTMAIELRESRGAGSSKSSQTNSSAGAASSAVAVAFSVFINVHSRSLNGNI